jgi:PAS domain S-box-containing protein
MITVDYQDKVDHPVLEEFSHCFQSNPVGIFAIDTAGCLRHINQRASEIFGYADTNEAVGKPLTQLEFFLSKPIIDRINQSLDDGQPFKIHCFPGTNLAGHFAHYCLSCNCSFDDDGQANGIFGIIEDVSDQVKRQRELKDRVEELSILSQISQEVSSAIDTDEVIKVILTGVTARQGLGFNRAFLFLLDDESRMLTGRLAIGPTDADEAGKIWSSLEQDERSLPELLSLYQEESERSNRNLTDLISGMRIDITNGSLFARAMQERTPLVIGWETELDRITERILGRLGEKQVAMTPLVTRDRSVGLLLVDNAITHKEITDDDRQFLKLIADQTAAAVERSYLYRDLRERAVELERINRKLAETQNQIIEAEKMSVIGEITSAVAHELRNPLTIIGGFANLMNKGHDPGSSDAEYLNIIISETQRAEGVLTDVLDFSKASKAKDRRLELNGLVRQAFDMLTVRMGSSRNRIRSALSDTDLPLWGNPDQLLHAYYQILWTLIQDLPVEVIPKVSTYALPGASRMEICCDHAPRHREKVEKILGQYFGASNSTKRLSLIVAEETLKHHGGNLGVESNPEEGPVLFVQLPLYKEKTDA